jgi:hypothetical protein
MKYISLIYLLFLSTFSFSQEIFSEKYPGCTSSIFSLEKDTANSKLNKISFTTLFREKIGPKKFKKIEGILYLQIIIDTSGNSCLMSVENKTNLKSEELKLKDIVNSGQVWSKPNKTVSVLLIMKFLDHSVSFRRIGRGCNGWQDIQE